MDEPAMPITKVLEAQIDHVSILDEHGNFDESLGKDLIPDEDLIKLYGHMVICRLLDEVAFKLQRSGRMGTYPQNMGQEAPSLGASYALEQTDWMVTCYRENCGLFWRGRSRSCSRSRYSRRAMRAMRMRCRCSRLSSLSRWANRDLACPRAQYDRYWLCKTTAENFRRSSIRCRAT